MSRGPDPATADTQGNAHHREAEDDGSGGQEGCPTFYDGRAGVEEESAGERACKPGK